MTKDVTERIALGDNGRAANLLGEHDDNLAVLEKQLAAEVLVRGNEILLRGTAAEVATAKEVLHHLQILADADIPVTRAAVSYALSVSGQKSGDAAKLTQTLYVTPRGKQIKIKTFGQKGYVEDIKNHDITFAIGPAGTGKTYLAVVMAVVALKAKEVSKILLVRPAVEAGEKLGFLPGDLQEKVNPYLRPIYDALDDVLGAEMAAKYIERNVIEVVPLAYMRGRTLDEAFIILDEAQNTTSPQMKMFLTRLGIGSKAVVTGDITQIDLPTGESSGLIDAQQVLGEIPDIAFCYLTEVDVVRHPLVQEIICAYQRQKERSASPASKR